MHFTDEMLDILANDNLISSRIESESLYWSNRGKNIFKVQLLEGTL